MFHSFICTNKKNHHLSSIEICFEIFMKFGILNGKSYHFDYIQNRDTKIVYLNFKFAILCR